MKKTFLALAAASLALPAMPVAADPPPWAHAHGYRHHQREAARRYHYTGNHIRYWRGNDGRYYCHRSNGTTGTIVGAAVGALAGRAIDTRGERTTGTVLGAAVGALLGRQIQRGQVRCR
jgi:glycine zipper 2TM protein